MLGSELLLEITLLSDILLPFYMLLGSASLMLHSVQARVNAWALYSGRWAVLRLSSSMGANTSREAQLSRMSGGQGTSPSP